MSSLAAALQNDPNTRFHGCSSINQYEVLEKLGEGTFGEVHKAKSHKTGALVALKKILMHNEKDGFPITALREIKLLKMLSHGNVLQLVEMAIERPKVGKERKKAIMYMVTPYMDHDLLGLLANPDVQFSEAQIKCYMLQLLEGVRYLHDSHILHRDMKAANLLIDNKGCLRIADFGLARHYDEPVPRPGKGGGEARREYTALVVTRWYRPPELLLQLRTYTTAIDMWGVGCVFGEMFKQKPILTGSSDLNQIQIIFDLVGSPTEDNMPGWSSLPGCEGVTSFDHRPGNLPQVFREQGSSAISLLTDLLRLDWRRRITAIDALEHPYFRTAPLPARPGDLPTYEHSHELDRRKFATSKKLAAPPPAPAGGTVGMGANPNGDWGAAPGPNGSFNSGPPSRDSRGGWGPDRPPRGHDAWSRPPPVHYDRDRPPRDPAFDQRRQPPYAAQPPLQRPGWQQQRTDVPPPPLLATPPLPKEVQRSGGAKDTYIPPYSAANPPSSQTRPRDNQGVAPPDERGAYPRNDRGPPATRDERQGPARVERGQPLQDGRSWEHQASRDDGHGYRARDYPPGRHDQRAPPLSAHGNDRDRDHARNGVGPGGGRQGHGPPLGGDHRNRPRSRSPHNRDGYRR